MTSGGKKKRWDINQCNDHRHLSAKILSKQVERLKI